MKRSSIIVLILIVGLIAILVGSFAWLFLVWKGPSSSQISPTGETPVFLDKMVFDDTLTPSDPMRFYGLNMYARNYFNMALLEGIQVRFYASYNADKSPLDVYLTNNSVDTLDVATNLTLGSEEAWSVHFNQTNISENYFDLIVMYHIHYIDLDDPLVSEKFPDVQFRVVLYPEYVIP